MELFFFVNTATFAQVNVFTDGAKNLDGFRFDRKINTPIAISTIDARDLFKTQSFVSHRFGVRNLFGNQVRQHRRDLFFFLTFTGEDADSF